MLGGNESTGGPPPVIQERPADHRGASVEVPQHKGEGHPISSSVVNERDIPTIPTEDFGSPRGRRPAADDFRPTVQPQERPPHSYPLEDVPEAVEANPYPHKPANPLSMHRWYGPSVGRGPQSHPVAPEGPEEPLDDGGGWGNGGQPPPLWRYNPSGAGGPHPPGDSAGSWSFVFLGLVTSYFIYQWFFQQFQMKVERLLNQFEEVKNSKEGVKETASTPETIRAAMVPPQRGGARVSILKTRFYDVLQGCGLLVGGILAGGGLARRAIEVTVMPAVRQIGEAVVPALARSIFGPFVNVLTQAALAVWSPIPNYSPFSCWLGPF